jgi:hypothetical protein
MRCRSVGSGMAMPMPSRMQSATQCTAADHMIRLYDDAGNVIETHEHNGDFKEW